MQREELFITRAHPFMNAAVSNSDGTALYRPGEICAANAAADTGQIVAGSAEWGFLTRARSAAAQMDGLAAI